MQETAFWGTFQKILFTKDFTKVNLRISFKRRMLKYERYYLPKILLRKNLKVRKINYKRGKAALKKGSLFA